LNHVPAGIDTERVLTASLSLPGTRYPGDAEKQDFWTRAIDRLRAIPGVDVLADSRPPAHGSDPNKFNLEDHPTPPGQNQPLASWIRVSTGYFKAVGL